MYILWIVKNIYLFRESNRNASCNHCTLKLIRFQPDEVKRQLKRTEYGGGKKCSEFDEERFV